MSELDAQQLENGPIWIRASRALDTVVERSGMRSDSAVSLCKRAKAGLIVTRAALLKIGGKTLTDEGVPPQFWWAEGHGALDQDWTAGDFSTWIDGSGGKEHWQAFGVQFDLRGIDAMLPRPVDAKASDDDEARPRLPEAELQRWWSTMHRKGLAEALTQKQLLAIVRDEFQSHSVARDRVEALTAGRKRGPKVLPDKKIGK